MSTVKCTGCKATIPDALDICSDCGCPSRAYWSMLLETKQVEKANKLGDEMRAQGKYKAARQYYAIGAAEENTYAQVWLGNLFRDGLGGAQSYVEASCWYVRAAEQGDAEATARLAELKNSTTSKLSATNKVSRINTYSAQRYDVPMPPKPKIAKGIIIYAAIYILFVLWLTSIEDWVFMDGSFFVLISFFAPIVIYAINFVRSLLEYNLAHTDYPQYAKKMKEIEEKENARLVEAHAELEEEYKEALASQKRTEPWAIRYSTSPCPHCGHYKVRYAKWEDKSLSVAFWGIASSKLGTSYKCEHCKRMWE